MHYGKNKQAKLLPEHVSLLRRCDGRTSASEIARSLAAEPGLEFEDEAHVSELMQELVGKGLCSADVGVPTVPRWPHDFINYLERFRAPNGRVDEVAAGVIDSLLEHQRLIGAAAGDHERLALELERLQNTFESITNKSGTRRLGEAYAGRSLVYEECRRNVAMAIGPNISERLAKPMSIVLLSARWFSYRVSQLYLQAFEDTFERLIEDSADSCRFLSFWREVLPLFPEPPMVADPIEIARKELQGKWAALLSRREGLEDICVNSKDIRRAAEEIFAAPGAGWPGARFHSPDIMIAAASTDCVASGGGLFVLGELHPSVNSFHFCAQREHPQTKEIIDAEIRGQPVPVAMPVISREQTTRADYISFSPANFDIELGMTPSWRASNNVARVSDLVVEEHDKKLYVVDEAGEMRLPILAFFDSHLSSVTGPRYRILEAAERSPRVQIDDLIVARREWRFAPGTLPFVAEKRGPGRLAAVRSWVHEHEIPRRVFAKTEQEAKPFYIDFLSPIYIELLVKICRAPTRLTLSEMMPSPEQFWLADEADDAVCSELRFVVVDPEPWIGETEGRG